LNWNLSNMDLFKDLIPSLIQKKKYILTLENEKDYTPYVVNMALSQHIDCVLYVNEMNRYPDLDNKLQYDFYYHSLVARNRPYQKWLKSTNSPDMINVKEYFSSSTSKAKEALKILTPEQLKSIAEYVDKGGTVK